MSKEDPIVVYPEPPAQGPTSEKSLVEIGSETQQQEDEER